MVGIQNIIFPDVEDVSHSLQQFGWLDYIIVLAMLVSCSLIGVYFGVQGKRKQENGKSRKGSSALDYMIGGRKMNIFPIAMSLIASLVSGISFLGSSTETYLYGSAFMFIIVGILICGVIMNFVFLPVFLDLKLTSTYEYLEARFDKRARLFGAFLFSLGAALKLPIIIYVPALALNQAAGLNIHIITTVMCVICIFYTSVGGIKAVVWTDTLQVGVMFACVFSIIGYGIHSVGGLGTVIERNLISGRIELPPFSFDLTERHTILSLIIGGTSFHIQMNAISQCMIQRYFSLPSISAARKALWIFVVGACLINFCTSFNGLLVYAKYYDCDPLTTKLAKAKDQLLPLFVMDIFRNVPGVPGLFIAGIISATLSTLSTNLNSLTSVFYEDFVKPHVKKPLSDKAVNNILRFVVVIYGVLAVVLVLVVEKLGAVLQLSMTLQTITNGPLLSLFIIGLMIPWINGKSAFIGGCSSLIVMGWLSIKSQLLAASGLMTIAVKPLTTDGCVYNFTRTNLIPTINPVAEEKTFYHLSYLWYVLFGTAVSIIMACFSSCIFGWNKPGDVDENVIAPFVRKYFGFSQKDYNEKTITDADEYKIITHKFTEEE